MTRSYERSKELFAAAERVLPGGVNSPVRAFRGVGGSPLMIERGEGASMWDVDGNRYIDYVLSWGPLVLGHAHPAVVEALNKQVTLGTSYGAPTALETELAELVIQVMPGIEQIRFVNSGTEATMSALRLARAFTGREKIIKFSGCYHGHADMLLVQAGSGVVTLGLPDSPGVPASTTASTLVAEYNDLEGVRALFQEQGEHIAAVIVEPIAANMGFVLPSEGFLQGLRDVTREHGALLIFDEVMTGFRVSLAGAQGRWGLDPDLTCLGKVIGGGLPVGAYAGKREIMQKVAPAGPMYQAGTLSGNPLAMVAGLVTIQQLAAEGAFAQIEQKVTRLAEGLQSAVDEMGIPVQMAHVGSMFGCYFLNDEAANQPANPITNYTTVRKYAHPQRYARFFWNLIDRGVYFAPSQFEAGFMSLAHTDDDIDHTLTAVRESLVQLQGV